MVMVVVIMMIHNNDDEDKEFLFVGFAMNVLIGVVCPCVCWEVKRVYEIVVNVKCGYKCVGSCSLLAHSK